MLSNYRGVDQLKWNDDEVDDELDDPLHETLRRRLCSFTEEANMNTRAHQLAPSLVFEQVG